MPFQYGKVPLTPNTPVPIDLGGQGISGIVIGNESGYTVTVDMQSGASKSTLYPGTVDFFPVPVSRNWNGLLVLTPTADLTNISAWPGSHLYIDVYGVGEAPKGAYPLALNRAGNLGNQVTLVAGSATSVQNDNNPSGTTVVEATVLGSPSSNVSILNDGSGWFGMWNNPTFTKIFQWFSSGTTILRLGAATLLTRVLGNFQVDGTTTLTGSVSMGGTASFNNAGSSVDASNNFNGNAVNVNAVNTGSVAATGNETVGGTLAVTGNTTLSSVSITSTETHNNNQNIQWKDSGGTARNVINVDSSNNVNIMGITGTDLIRFMKSDGVTVEALFDTSLGIFSPTGKSQTVNGDTSGSMTIQECFGGPVKMVIITQNNYRQAGAKQMFTLNKPFTVFCGILNLGCGGIEGDSSGTAQAVQQATWGTGTSAGTSAGNTQAPTDSAGYIVHAVDALGSPGGYASPHTGLTLVFGQ